MMTPKNVKAKTAIEYFKKGYYQSNDKGEWLSKGAEVLGLKGEIQDFQAYENIVNGLTPDASQRLSQRQVDEDKRKAAVDCTFAAPKSVSLCALVGGDERLIEAHNQAVKKVLAVMERDYSQTRIGTGNNREVVKTGNLVIAKFNHIETRELDPHLHSHCLVMNATQAPDGAWYSHLNDAIYSNQKLLGMMYQHHLAQEVERLGYEVEWHEHGQFDIKGFNPEHLTDFSKRRQQILAATGDHASCQEREKAQKKTRRNKELVTPEELKARWQEEAKLLGLQIVQPNTAIAPLQQSKGLEIDQKLFEDAIKHCSEKRVDFKKEDLAKFILSHSQRTVDIEQLQPLIDSRAELIRLDYSSGVRYTTQTAVQLELDTIRLMQSRQRAIASITHPEVVEHHLAETTLNSGQRQGVMMALTTNDQVVAWQGVAGSGKTFALKHVKALAQARGYEVKGFAPSAKAARVLGKDLDSETQTVARLLHSKLPEEVQPNQLWIVDEAGLLSAKDAHTLLQRAIAEPARVILVGDTKQLSAVEAGSPFKSLQQHGMKTAYLTESQRQKNPELKLAIDLLADNRIEAGFNKLLADGSIQTVTAATKVDEIVKAYLQLTPQERQQTLLLAGTNQERRTITTALRQQLKAEGSLGEDFTLTQLRAKDLSAVEMQSYLSQFSVGNMVMPLREYKRKGLVKGGLYEIVGKTRDQLQLKSADGTQLTVGLDFKKAVFEREQIQIAVGDRLMWKKNNQALEQVNGEEIIVKAIAGNHVEVEELNGKRHTIDLTQPHHLDHALVRTTYSSQGETADRVLVAADSTIGKESFYVAASRARHELRFFTQSNKKLLEWALESKAQDNPLELIRQQLEQQMQLETAALASQPVASSTVVIEKPQPPLSSVSVVSSDISTAPPTKRTDLPSRPTIAPPVKRTTKLPEQVPTQPTAKPPVEQPIKKSQPVPHQSSTQPRVQLPTEQSTDSAEITITAKRQLPPVPDWLTAGQHVHCHRQGWGEIEAVLGAQLRVLLNSGEQVRILDWSQAVESKLVIPAPTEAFWTPEKVETAPSHIESAHWQELQEGSVIHPRIASRNFKSLEHDMVEQAHEAWEHLFYSDKLERTNTGRLTTGILNRFTHIEAGGWWCNAGVDPRCFLDLQPGQKPEEKLWGCFKPDSPRTDSEKPDKKIKYEHPLKTDLSIFLLEVPKEIADRIYEKNGVSPSESDRASGFWYCAWKHNLPVTLTEGAKKAASLLSQGHTAIGLPGIYAGYRSKDEQGNEIEARLHEELAVFATPGREIQFCFDYETRAKTLHNIQTAIARTGSLLEHQGAKVSVVTLPGPDKGVDDLIKARGPLAYERVTTVALGLRAWREQNKQQQEQQRLQPPRKISLEERLERQRAKQAAQKLSPEPDVNVTQTPENTHERPINQRQQSAHNTDAPGRDQRTVDPTRSHINSENRGTRSQPGNQLSRSTGLVQQLSDAINRAVERQEVEQLTGAIAGTNQCLAECQFSTARHQAIGTAIAQLHRRLATELQQRTNTQLLEAISAHVDLAAIESEPLAQALEKVTSQLQQFQSAEWVKGVESLDAAISQHLRSVESSIAPIEESTSLSPPVGKPIKEPFQLSVSAEELSLAINEVVEHEAVEQLTDAITSLTHTLREQPLTTTRLDNLTAVVKQFQANAVAQRQQQIAQDLAGAIASNSELSAVEDESIVQALKTLSQNLNQLQTSDKAEALRLLNATVSDLQQSITTRSDSAALADQLPPFSPPVPDESQWAVVQKYLTEERGLPKSIVDELHRQRTLYADSQQNAVLIRQSLDGEVLGADLCGTYQNSQFKDIATGTRTWESWFKLQHGQGQLERIVLVESPIEAMSAAALARQTGVTLFVATDGAAEAPLVDWLQQQQNAGVKVLVGYGNDPVGDEMARQVREALPGAARTLPHNGHKDWNQQLVKQATLIAQLEQVSSQEFLQLGQQVTKYLQTVPPRPPSNTDQQHVHDEIKRLERQLEQLQIQQAAQVKQVGQMQQNPLCAWNKKYQAAVAQLQKNVEMVQQSLAQKNQQESQLQQWAKLASVRSDWLKDPHTLHVRDIASALNLPQMRQRFYQIQEERQRQEELKRTQQQQQRRGRGR